MTPQETIVFEQDNKQVIQKGNHFFTRVFDNGESFESGDFNTLERAKASLGIENIYLNRLKEQYKEHKKAQKVFHGVEQLKYKIRYQAMRLFCLDTQLISFNDVEVMEYEVNIEINSSF